MSQIPRDEGTFGRVALAFLEASASPRPATRSTTWGVGSDRVALFEERAAPEELVAAKTWRASKFDAGFGWLSGPEALGGGGLPRSFESVWNRLEAGYDVPVGRKYFTVGLGIVAPALLRHADDMLAAMVLPRLFRGEILACQLFSEPGSGSDLASLAMTAVRDGDGWRLNGQKVWTSVAHLADYGLAICRTDAAAGKHAGLTAFLVDMRTDGVTVRPLRQMTGGASFNEVFLDDVHVPDSFRVGWEGDGWRVASTALLNERASIGLSGGGGSGGGLTSPQGLAEILRRQGRADDPVLRQRYAEIYSLFRITRFTVERSMAAVGSTATPGPELSTVKLLVTKRLQLVSELLSACLGAKLVADGGEWGTYGWSHFVLGYPGMRIAGGTDEILKNILAERVLGLPREPA